MIKKTIKKFLPSFLVNNIWNFKKYFIDLNFKKKNTEDIFSEIYKKNFWGRKKNNVFYSGPGSHDFSIVDQYVFFLKEYFSNKKINTIVDLGCGDYNIGKQIFSIGKKYIGCDIVEELINYNNKNYGSDNITFKNINIIIDNLPDGDVCIIRQVFQHLSNNQIATVLKKLYKYRYIVITEHLPLQEFEPNLDKLCGPYTRCDMEVKSGIVIEKSPFNFKYLNKKTILRNSHLDAVLETIVYQIK